MPERPEIAQARERLASLLPAAMDTMEDLLGSHSEGARLGAARDVLDRGGVPVEQRVEHHIDIDLDDRIKEVLGKLSKAHELAYKGADNVLMELAGGTPDVIQASLFDNPEALPDDDEIVVEAEIVEDAYWQASANSNPVSE